MAGREDRTDVRLLEQVTFDAADQKVLLVDNREIARADAQQADIRPAYGSRQLEACIDRHLLSAEESDLPTEERVHVGACRRDASRRLRATAGKAEHPRPLQEERPLLRKEHREA